MARVVVAVLLCLGALGLAGPGAYASSFSAAQLTLEPGPGVTLAVGGRPYAGDLVVAPDRTGVDVVDRVDFEQYVEGIGEMPSNWPAAALQAQAVAARTYALWTVLTHPPGPGGGQICATDACQVYAGLSKPEGPDGSRWVQAVEATRGQVLQYQGRIIEALYGSSDGGQTLYGGVPWLPSVADPEDRLAPEHQWSWSVPLARMAAVLGVPAGQTLTSLVSSSTAITETRRDPAGRQSTVALSPSQFHAQVNSGMAAPAGLDLPLPSYRYSVSTYGTAVTVAGAGDGNALGLSQYGALGKAEEGWTAGQILAGYYKGAAVGDLPAGEMPATVSVTLVSDRSDSTITADGPVRILDSQGRPVATTTGPAAWTAGPVAAAGAAGAGVGLTAAPGIPTTPVADPSADNAPVPQRAAPPAGGQASPSPAPSTVHTAGSSPDRAKPDRVAASMIAGRAGAGVSGSGTVAPVGVDEAGSLAATAHPAGSPLGPAGAGAAVLVVVAGAAWTRRFRRDRQPKGSGCAAGE